MRLEVSRVDNAPSDAHVSQVNGPEDEDEGTPRESAGVDDASPDDAWDAFDLDGPDGGDDE